MMKQQALDLPHDSIYQALTDAVRAAGGSKTMAALLWGQSRDPIQAERKLDDCLNPERREKLSPQEVIAILRAARDRGYHGAMQYLAASAGYQAPTPLEPAHEAAQLQREFIDAVTRLERLQKQLDPLITPRARLVG
jgi:hypothetical protein